MARGQITITEIQDGRSITDVDVQYYLSTSSTSLAGGSWSTTAPDWVDGKYMWSKTVTTYSTGSPTESTPVCITGGKGSTGSDGKGITSAVVTYQNHTNGSTAPTGTWSDTIPAVIKGRYLWTRTMTTYTDNSVIPTYSVSYYATDGEDGSDGADGKGIVSTDIHYKLGTSGTLIPTGTWATSPPTPVKGQYLWTRTVINYTTGSPSTSYSTSYYATDGQKGDKGDTGASGQDAITILLSNESHTFAGNISNALASSTVVNIIAYKGATRVTSTIGTITGHVDGLTTSIAGNGTTSNAFTVSATTALVTANGVLTIPITVDGRSFTKNFSFAVSFKGATGNTGSTGASGADAKVITLTASAQIFTKPKTGSVTPSTITVTGTTQNTTIATWQYSTNGGAFTTTLPTGVTRSGNVVTINGTTMNAKTIAVKAFNGAVQDTVTIAKVEDGVDGNTGATGRGVSSIVEEFYLSTSKTTQTGGSWSTTMPTWSPGKYVWTRSDVRYSDAPSTPVYVGLLVDSSWEAVNEIEVGGRNLVIRHNELENVGVGVTGTVQEMMGIATTLDYIPVIPGQVYTFTKTNSAVSDGGFWRWRCLDENEEYISRVDSNSNQFQWTVPSNVYFIQVSYPIDAQPKLEKGNKATDWTPAPEDIDADIAGVRNNLSETQNDLSETQNDLSETQNDLSETQNDLSETQTSLEETQNDLSETQNNLSETQTNLAETQNNLTTLQNNLGSLAYDDAVEVAKLGTTIIENGYLVTSLIEAGSIGTDLLAARAVTADKIASGTITAESGIISSIDANTITSGVLQSANGGSWINLDDGTFSLGGRITLTPDGLNLDFSGTPYANILNDQVDKMDQMQSLFDFDPITGLTVGRTESIYKINIDDDQMTFINNETPVASITGEKMSIESVEIAKSAVIGYHSIEKYHGANMTLFKYVKSEVT